MSGRPGAHLAKVVETIKFLRDGDRTFPELIQMTGFDEHTISAHVRAGVEIGLIEAIGRVPRREGAAGSTPMVYRFVPARERQSV